MWEAAFKGKREGGDEQANSEVKKGSQDMAESNMTVMERIQEHLSAEGVEFEIREDNEAIRFNVGAEMIEEPLLCTIFTDEDSFVTVVDLPFECEMSCLDEMAKFLTQINCGMWMGNFDLDYDDGEITFSCETGVDMTIKCDAVIEAMDMLPNTDLLDELDGIEVYAVGDCAKPFNIAEAIGAGNMTARKI